jgi:tetratricopeptide (TPR) repeat protein
MKKLIGTSVLGFSVCLTGVHAQTAAEINYKEALEVFKQENYSKSIKLLESAVGLNENDPSLWLLLGKSYYQMGNIELAVKAFEKTIKLAPNEKYAAGMLSNLVKNSGTVEQRLRLIQELIDKEYFTLAAAESSLISEMVISNKERSQLLFEKVRIAIGLKRNEEAVLFIEKLKNDHKDFDGLDKIQLIETTVNLQSRNAFKVLNAVKSLEKLSSHKEKSISSHALLLLLKYKLKGKTSLKNVEALNKWFNENKDSKFYLEVCRSLIDLNKKLNTETPRQTLSKEDKKIFELL